MKSIKNYLAEIKYTKIFRTLLINYTPWSFKLIQAATISVLAVLNKKKNLYVLGQFRFYQIYFRLLPSKIGISNNKIKYKCTINFVLLKILVKCWKGE